MKTDERLFSLDALRGLDMIFLCLAKPVIVATAQALGCGDVEAYPFMRQFTHPWGGFTAYDLIMPLFIFMCGAAVPFALPKRLNAEGRPTAAFWRHVAQSRENATCRAFRRVGQRASASQAACRVGLAKRGFAITSQERKLR